MEATWLNDRDQFLYPNNNWKKDIEFQNDCLIFTLFHGQNRVTSKGNVNYWIPFAEKDVEAKDEYKSHFMLDFLKGKIRHKNKKDKYLFNTSEDNNLSKTVATKNSSVQVSKSQPLVLSLEAQEVFDSAKELWKYYHSQKDSNADASFYDIREYFQGRASNGRMNNNSTDERYNTLISNLREKQKLLAKKISRKAYEYEFLQP